MSQQTDDLALAIEAQRPRLLTDFERAVLDIEGVAGASPTHLRMIADADAMLSELVDTLRAKSAGPGTFGSTAGSSEDTVGDPAAGHPRERLIAGEVLFDLVVNRLARMLAGSDDQLEKMTLAAGALQRSLLRRLDNSITEHTGQLLDKVHGAQVAERRRVARDLHDRAGFWLNTAYRQLELCESAGDTTDARSTGDRIRTAGDAVRQAMEVVRAVTVGLRLTEQMTSLEDALRTALEAHDAGAMVQLNVNGAEAWAPSTVKDEVFLIVLEAVRNALTHGFATLVVVRIDIAPHELRVLVHDNGRWSPATPGRHRPGIGLATMRERAEIMRGTLTVTSALRSGTRVELVVPLMES
jgi:signal transduction histidine kinase